MSAKRHQLTATVQQTIVSYIRAGSYPEVAAEAAGIPADVFHDWLARAEQPRAAARYRDFADAVRQARAHARLTAEVETRTNKPTDWLKSGPGRETADREGWTGPPRAITTSVPPSPLQSPEGQQVFAALLEALTPWPEARAAVAAVIEKISPTSAPKRSHRRRSGA